MGKSFSALSASLKLFPIGSELNIVNINCSDWLDGSGTEIGQ